jgi:hypothetical protein
MIGLVSLNPYWDNGILMVSQGESQADILEFLEECHKADGNVKEFRKIHAAWKKLIHDKAVKVGIQNIDDPKHSVQGTLFQEDYGSSPLLLMILPKSFDHTNYEHMITLAHECLHVCQAFLPKYLNRDEEQEAEAYFHSYLMRQIVEFIK